jgi:hypothetical protein
MDTGSFPLTRRVGRLRLRMVTKCGPGFRDIYFRLLHVPSSTQYFPPGDKIKTHGFGLLSEIDLGEINPVTLLPWTPLDVRGFGSAANVWQVQITGAGSAASPLQVLSLELEVQYVVAENRLAVGTWRRPPMTTTTLPDLITLDALVRPDGSGGWTNGFSKVNGVDHIYVPRRAHDLMVGGNLAPATDIRWHFVGGNDSAGSNPPPVPEMRSADVTIAANSSMVGAVMTATPFTGHLAGTVVPLVSGSGAASVDSQPYMAPGEAGMLAVGDDTSILTTFVAPASAAYLGIRFVVRPPADGEGTLRVTVHSWNGTTPALANPQIGGVLDISAADLLATAAMPNMPAGYREVSGFLDLAASLTATGDYYVKLNKIDGTAGTTWDLQPVDTDENTSRSFQGTADGFLYALDDIGGGSIAATDLNIGLVLYQQPPPPTGLAASVVTDPQVFFYGGCVVSGAGCDVEAIDGIHLSWGSPTTGYGSLFEAWNVQRRDFGSDQWWQIGHGISAANKFFTDWELTRNRPAKYRVRTELTDGSFSAWVETAPVVLDSPGAVGDGASTPDHPDFALVDLDFRAYVAADDWTPGGFGSIIAGQWIAPSQQQWYLGIDTTGRLVFGYSTTGANTTTRTATVATGFANGTPHWVRVTFDANNGSGQHVVTFYGSDDGVTWTTIGAPVVTAGTVTMFNSTSPLQVGPLLGFAGQVRSLELRPLIDGTIATNPDFTIQPVGATSLVDSTGKTWTVVGAAQLVGTGEGIAQSYDAEVLFVSNARPDLNVAYTYDPEVPVEFLDHENDHLMVVQGAPFRVAFLDPHNRGMGITYRIRPVFGEPPVDEIGFPLPIEEVYAPLVNIARSRGGRTIPYVCVLDYEGGRRFGYIRLGNGARDILDVNVPGYELNVAVTPLTDRPAVVEF